GDRRSLNPAYAHGTHTMVPTMMTAATTQPSAIHRPPHTIHAMLSRRERTDILRHLTHAPGANVDTEIGACQPRMKWLRHWFDAGGRAIEDVLARDPRTERFCYGDRSAWWHI